MARPWTREEVSASGQVFEFRLWAALTEQSRGALHVFLPMTDRGLDGLVHRVTDGTYTLVQAKGRSALMDGEVHLVVRADSIPHDEVVIVSGLVVDGGLGPTMLVVPVRDFKRLAVATTDEGEPVYSMEFGMRPRSDSHWLQWLVPAERLTERFGISAAAAAEAPAPVLPSRRSDLGYLGELEVMRRLGESGELNLFRAFPDWETVEIPVLHLTRRTIVGLQVKTVSVSRARPRATVDVLASSFRAAPTTCFIVLGWFADAAGFAEECLVVPSEEIAKIARDDGHGHLELQFHASPDGGPLDRYRTPISGLRAAVEELLLRS